MSTDLVNPTGERLERHYFNSFDIQIFMGLLTILTFT